MNLTIHEMITAHAARIADACNQAHERLMCLDQDRQVPDEQVFLDSVLGDKGVDIPVSVIDETIRISDITAEVADRLREVETAIMTTGNGATHCDQAWVAVSCWKLEMARRGEDMPVTMGARPVAMRVMAMLMAEREEQNIPMHEVEMTLRPRWATGLRRIVDERVGAQEFVETVVPNITHTDSDDTTSLQFDTPRTPGGRIVEPVPGHPYEVTLEFCPGQINAVMTMLMQGDDDGGDIKVAVIDDDTLILPHRLPETALTKAIGEPLETLFAHEIVRGLGLVIESCDQSGEDLVIRFARTAAKGLVVRDFPTNWWL